MEASWGPPAHLRCPHATHTTLIGGLVRASTSFGIEDLIAVTALHTPLIGGLVRASTSLGVDCLVVPRF
ncbi:Hypothetical protein CAP_0367 [Chondromyces apiculatus DSM 436]|uniref:Uncharacterized protein n=1 Tax=Chondromyces apiculatus DSM 436 TaxID=1192034 RepID=A0A017SWI9_9BACT|nr:Hypothetical protein CAP_0367 [Chondromyces apiculatus DSM 436]